MSSQNDKTAFVLYHDIRPALERLNDEQRGRLFLAILDYSENGEVPDFGEDLALDIAFTFIKASLDRDAAVWDRKRNARAAAGQKGGQETQRRRREKEAEEASKTSIA